MRKTIDVTITEDNRDKGQTYRITEMPARQAEKWAMRLLLALVRNGAVPDTMVGAGMAGLASMAASVVVHGLGLVNFGTEIEPLLDEMMPCIEFVPDPRNPALPPRPLLPDEPEEVSTLFRLRQEWVACHLGFSGAGELLTWMSKTAPPAAGDSSNTQTFPQSSAA